MIHRTQIIKKKWTLRQRFSSTKENRVHQTQISMKTDKDGFSPAVFKSRLDQKNPVIQCLVCCFCVLSLMAKSMERMAIFLRSCCLKFYFFELSAGKVPLGRCLANQKLTFDERISCIVKHDDFSPRSHRAVSQQVTPFLVHCKGRGDRCRAVQIENECV